MDHPIITQIPCNVWIQQAKFAKHKMSSLVPLLRWSFAGKTAPFWKSWSLLSNPYIFCWYLVISFVHWTVTIYWPLRQVNSVFLITRDCLQIGVSWNISILHQQEVCDYCKVVRRPPFQTPISNLIRSYFPGKNFLFFWHVPPAITLRSSSKMASSPGNE